MAGSNAPGAFLVSRGFVLFFGGHLPQTSGFRSAKEIFVVSFATQPRGFILSDRNIFYTPPGGEQRRGLMPLGLFLLFLWSLAPDFPRPNKYALQTFGQHKQCLQ